MENKDLKRISAILETMEMVRELKRDIRRLELRILYKNGILESIRRARSSRMIRKQAEKGISV